jgi:hypothetical protein
MIDKSTSAFPYQPIGSDGLPEMASWPGMTLREWFAGHALAGLLANPSIGYLSQEQIASDAVLFADALLEQLTK